MRYASVLAQEARFKQGTSVRRTSNSNLDVPFSTPLQMAPRERAARAPAHLRLLDLPAHIPLLWTSNQRIQQSSIYVDHVLGDRAFEMAYLQRAVEERKTSFLLSSFPFSTDKR